MENKNDNEKKKLTEKQREYHRNYYHIIRKNQIKKKKNVNDIPTVKNVGKIVVSF